MSQTRVFRGIIYGTYSMDEIHEKRVFRNENEKVNVNGRVMKQAKGAKLSTIVSN